MNQRPLVTVNLVTRNRCASLRRAIESVFAQTYRPLEVVVVDNDSCDGTPTMVESRWPDVRLIRIHRNIGCQPGRNIGMKNARGTYIFNLDDDGTLPSDAIERVVAAFEREPDVAVVGTHVVDPNGRSDAATRDGERGPRYVANFSGGASAIRAVVLDRVGYFPEYVRAHSEEDLAFRLLDAGYEILWLPDVPMYHARSEIERDAIEIAYAQILHRLESVLRLEPWRRCLLNAAWKAGVDLVRAVQHGTLRGYVRGVLRFVYDLPRILSTRRPVRLWTTEKRDFLTYNAVYDGDVSRRFKRYPMWQAIRDRLRDRNVARLR